MYSKQEASLLTQQFWTTFGQYLAPVLSAEGKKINWVNYKTGQKAIRFTMTTNNNSAKIAVVISHKDIGIQENIFSKFLQHKHSFEGEAGDDWLWEPFTTDEHGKPISEIFKSLPDAKVLRKEDWPAIISFFKNNIIALDQFWCNWKYAFESD